MIKIPLLTLISLVALSRAEDGDLTGIDPDLIDKPSGNINFPGCFQDLVTADRNGDGIIHQKEYLGFIQEYGKNRRCFDTDKLTLEQNAAFNSLACICRSQEGTAANCCLGDNARIVTAGALTPSSRTEEQLQYLTAVCIVTDGTITGQCPPKIRVRETPPPVIIVPANTASTGGGGLSDGTKWAIIAAAIAAALLLLLLCCCCCVFRRRRAKALEEEEEEGFGGKPGDDVETAPEQYPGGSDRDLPVSAAAVPPGSDDDSSYEGEGRKSRGQNFAEEEDDETRRRLRGEGEIAPENNPHEPVQLRPPPPKEPEEDPEWDYPGREINEHNTESDEYSAGYDHYEPGGGVNIPERPPAEPSEPYKNKWERLKKEEPDEVDLRKHRIQTGLGEGEVWDKLGENEEPEPASKAPEGDVFDWVVQSALGVLDKSDEAGHLDDEGSETVP